MDEMTDDYDKSVVMPSSCVGQDHDPQQTTTVVRNEEEPNVLSQLAGARLSTTNQHLSITTAEQIQTEGKCDSHRDYEQVASVPSISLDYSPACDSNCDPSQSVNEISPSDHKSSESAEVYDQLKLKVTNVRTTSAEDTQALSQTDVDDSNSCSPRLHSPIVSEIKIESTIADSSYGRTETYGKLLPSIHLTKLPVAILKAATSNNYEYVPAESLAEISQSSATNCQTQYHVKSASIAVHSKGSPASSADKTEIARVEVRMFAHFM